MEEMRGNGSSTSYAGSAIANPAQVVSFSAKVVVLRPEQTQRLKECMSLITKSQN